MGVRGLGSGERVGIVLNRCLATLKVAPTVGCKVTAVRQARRGDQGEICQSEIYGRLFKINPFGFRLYTPFHDSG